MDELDRILSETEPCEPSPDFTARVMRSVKRAHAEPPPLALPWARLAAGLACGGLTLAAAAVFLRLAADGAGLSREALLVTWTCVLLGATWVVARLCAWQTSP